MTQPYLRALGTVAAMIGLWCAPAAADPIQITSGSLQITRTTGTLSLAGTRGFTMTGTVGVLDGVFQPWETCHVSPVCTPGAVIDIGALWSGLALQGVTVTLDGRTFASVGGLTSDNQAAVRFSGSLVAPAFDASTAAPAAPFTFEGSFEYLEGMELLLGGGTTTLFLRRAFGENEGLPSAWDVEGARYDFTATPEPATLLLTAVGLAGLARRMRRNRDV